MPARLVLLLAAALQLGCYMYVPATLETVPARARVRAVITPTAQQRLQTMFGVQGSLLTGSLLQQSGDQVSLFVPSVPIGTGVGTRPLYQMVDVARADILRVDIRQVDTFRTGVVVAIAAGAAGVLLYQAVRGDQTVVTLPPPPPPAERRSRWMVRIPLPRP